MSRYAAVTIAYAALLCAACSAESVTREPLDGPPFVARQGGLGSACSLESGCLPDLICDPLSPGGYCRPNGCTAPCAEQGGVCAGEAGHGGRCWAPCPEGAAARGAPYECVEVDGRAVTATRGAAAAAIEYEELAGALGVRCDPEPLGADQFDQATHLIRFEVLGRSGFTIVPFVDRGVVRPTALIAPDRTSVDLLHDYNALNLRIDDLDDPRAPSGTYERVAFDWPIVVPYAASRAALAQSGTYALRVRADRGARVCAYVVEANPGGQTLALNFYLTDTQALSAASAPGDGPTQRMLARVREILGAAGIELGRVRYYNVPEPIAQMYRIPRDFEQARELMGWGRANSTEASDLLSIDIFLARDILFNDFNVLGISGGIPGAPGMHGNFGNGLIFSQLLMRANPEHTAHTVAHEIGHFLGLRHTTESAHGTPDQPIWDAAFGSTDPIDDTPICDSIEVQREGCPDASNMMFPFAPRPTPDPALPLITPEQTIILRNSALTR